MKEVLFPFDSSEGITINVLKDHKYSEVFSQRYDKEKLLRKIVSTLYENNILSRNKNIIDLGAWIGDNVLPWSKNINGIVYAIDPSPENCKFIKEMCNHNFISNVKIIEKAISDTERLLSTNQDLHHTCFNTVSYGSIKVQSTSLDSLYYNGEIDNIGLIHLDVEGMESLVIHGSLSLISIEKPIIAYEQHLNTENWIGLSKKIENRGYKTYMINEVLPGCRIDCRNFLAFPINLDINKILEILFNDLGQSDCLVPYNKVRV